MSYNVVDIIEESDRIELLQIYNSLPKKFVHQLYNIFHLEKVDVKNDIYQENEVFKKISESLYASSYEYSSSYFLKYISGSFSRIHFDNQTKRTIITILETKNLIGGESLFAVPYVKRPRDATHINGRNKKESVNPPYNKDIVYKVAKVSDGQSILYGPNQLHGVAEVEEGHRIVLVTWFK